MKDKNTYIKFEPKGIRIGYRVYRTAQEGGLITSYIPGFDIAFSSASKEIAIKRANAMVTHFFDYYVKNQSWREFMLKIHKLGFRTEMHDLQMKKLLNNRPVNAQFSPDDNLVDLNNIFSNPEEVVSELAHTELAY
jgi:hypothetical protein